jgi:hypothetical protein
MDNKDTPYIRFTSATAATTALDSSAFLHEMTFGGPEAPDRSPLGAEGDEEREDDDFSWMDDMEAAGAAPV